jgi:hypothetical protein
MVEFQICELEALPLPFSALLSNGLALLAVLGYYVTIIYHQ